MKISAQQMNANAKHVLQIRIGIKRKFLKLIVFPAAFVPSTSNCYFVDVTSQNVYIIVNKKNCQMYMFGYNDTLCCRFIIFFFFTPPIINVFMSSSRRSFNWV